MDELVPKRKQEVTQSGDVTRKPLSITYVYGGVTVRTMDLRSAGRGFNSRSGRYQVVTTWMSDCLRTAEPSWYIINTKVNSAFRPSGVGKSSSDLLGWC